MSLNPYCQAVLRHELAKPDYDGKTADQAWAWLTEPVVPPPVATPNGLRLTPVRLAKIIGAAKTEAVAAALKAAYPLTAGYLMEEGVDPQTQEAGAFLAQLVTAGVLTPADLAAVQASCVTVTQPSGYVRFDRRFLPADWPHVADDGTVSADTTQPAIHGFPNRIDRSDFDAAWVAAGRP